PHPPSIYTLSLHDALPIFAHGIELAIEMAQQGGVGLVVYNRKEGRALGEVTKFLVYNARKRQQGGDRPDSYFHRTVCVAGVEDRSEEHTSELQSRGHLVCR